MTSSLLFTENGAQIKGATFALLSRWPLTRTQYIHTYLAKRLASESDPAELALLNHSSSKLKEVVKDYAQRTEQSKFQTHFSLRDQNILLHPINDYLT